MNKTDIIFDFIFVGSSPIILFEAMHQRKSGKTVLILDDAPKLGGAWTTIDLDGFPDLELGCHIWSIHKPTFEFLDSYLDIPLKPLNPQPFILKNGRKVPYDWKMNVITIRRFISNILNGKLRNFKDDLKSPAYRLSIFPSIYVYPKYGSAEFIEAICSKANKLKVDIRVKSEIISAIRNGENIDVVTASGEVYKTRHLRLTSLSNIAEFDLGDKLIHPKNKKSEYIHVHIVLKDKIGEDFSYIRWMDDDLIHRVSDITGQINNDEDVDEKFRILIVGVHETGYSSENEPDLVDRILDKLRSQKLIGDSTEVFKWNFNIFHADYSNSVDCAKIVEQGAGSISLLQSTDLIFGMAAQLPRWKKSLMGDGS